MILNRAIKMRIYPDDEQRHKIDVTLSHCRYIYNKMLERNEKIYKRRKEHLNYYAMQNFLPEMKDYLPWLKEADSQALKYACRQLNTAFERFFRKQGGYPRFHSKRGKQSYTTTNTKNICVEPHRVKLPCLGWIRTSDVRIPDGKLCYATVSYDTDGRYYVSVCYEREVPDVKPITVSSEKTIGLDYKSDGLYTGSDGKKADIPHFYRQAQCKRTKLQRRLSKKQGSRKGEHKSANFMKQLRKVNKQSAHIANQRRDHLHKLSTEIANRYDAVCVEELNMKAMSNKGFGNGKATMDNGYGMFLDMLSYKLTERGKKLVRVDKWFPSSQLCHKCGHKKPMPLKIRTYRCPNCGMVCDRDLNAAINIKTEGLRLLSA